MYFEDLHPYTRQRLAELNPEQRPLLEPYLEQQPVYTGLTLEAFRRRKAELLKELRAAGSPRDVLMRRS
jgi:hypothetical protein